MPRPSHASQLAQQGVAWWEVSCLLWEQLNVTAAEAPMEGSLPCGRAAGTEKVLRLGEAPGLGLRPGVSGGGPRGTALMLHLGQMSLSMCGASRTASLTPPSVRPSLSPGHSGAEDRWPCPCAGPPPRPAGPRLPPSHLHGFCSIGRVRAPRGTKEDLRLHVLQAFYPLSPCWLQDGRHRQLLRRGQSQSSGVFMRRNSLKRLTWPAVN